MCYSSSGLDQPAVSQGMKSQQKPGIRWGSWEGIHDALWWISTTFQPDLLFFTSMPSISNRKTQNPKCCFNHGNLQIADFGIRDVQLLMSVQTFRYLKYQGPKILASPWLSLTMSDSHLEWLLLITAGILFPGTWLSLRKIHCAHGSGSVTHFWI